MNTMFTDIHHHILFGVDDGPSSLEMMKKMLDAAAADGTGTIIATSHANPGIEPFPANAYLSALEQANEYCIQRGLPLRVYPGAEVLYTQSAVRMLCDGKIPTLCQGPYVLVEWYGDETVQSVSRGVRELSNAGFVPVMAHVERLQCFLKSPERLMDLRAEYDMRLQINCNTVLKGPLSRRYRLMRMLCDQGMLDYVASDAHNLDSRPSRMGQAYEKLVRLYGQTYADALMSVNALEILRARNTI